jgi:hypothetical protein
MAGSLKIDSKEEPTAVSEKEKLVTKSKKSKKKSRKRQGDQKLSPETESSSRPSKRIRRPLNGLTVSVSTLSSGEVPGTTGTAEASFNAVSKSCKDLGADVTSQVCKRVQVLVCTKSAVQKSTQRVRKAFKKKIPIVEVGWLDKCRTEQERVDFGPFRLDEEAKEAIDNRQETIDNEKEAADVAPDTGWSEPVSFGCSCVCHENGAEKECKWCMDGCNA